MKKEFSLIQKIGILFLILGTTSIFLHKYPQNWRLGLLIKDFYANLSCSFLSISATILLINYIYEGREKENNKKRLIRELGSEDKGFTSRALKELKDLGHLTDGTLIGADLSKADLKGLDFSNANLKNVNFENAHLDNANLKNVNLQGANLNNSHFRSANLDSCNLSDTKMQNCNLYAAILNRSFITNSDLTSANLEQAELIEAQINNSRIADVNFKLANFTRAKFLKCLLMRSDIHSIDGKDTIFEDCDLNGLKNWDQIAHRDTTKFISPQNLPTGFHI